MQYFDTHAHIGLIYDDPIEQLLVCQEAKQAGVTRIVSICNSSDGLQAGVRKPQDHGACLPCGGVSPSEVQNPGKEWHRTIEEAVKLPRVIAVGEIGLDYYHKFGDRKSQIELFIDQLDLAARWTCRSSCITARRARM
jgi:TatD DNase family protein